MVGRTASAVGPGAARPRVFVGLSEVAGYYTKVASGLLDHGCAVTAVFLSDRFAYRHDDRLRRPPTWILRLVRGGSPNLLARARVAVGRAALLLWALPRHDLFIFASGGTFFRGHDLRVLRVLGKRSVAVFNGTDARPPYLSGLEWLPPDHVDLDRTRRRTAVVAAHVRRTERLVDAVVGHPAYAHFQSRPFHSYLAIGVPVPELPPRPAGTAARPTVLHAPTRPLHKGTPAIEGVLSTLEDEGVDHEYRKLVDLPNEVVLDALLTSTVVVDELHGDTLLGGIGVEGAAAGCAVVVCGYAGEVIEATHPGPLPPIRLLPPDELAAALRTVLLDPVEAQRQGRALRDFVEQHWRRSDVAGRLLAIARGEGDPSWLIDPLSVVYLHGWGVDRDQLRAGLAAYIERFGASALHLEHHPALRDALVADACTEAIER